MRTHRLSQVTEALAGETVTLCGWVNRQHAKGKVIFIRLRERSDLVQVVVESDSPAFSQASRLRNEFCVRITGTVTMRPESQWMEDQPSGKVEVFATEIEVLNASDPIPLLMTDEDGEETRLKYRYLDLRRPRMQHNLRIRAALYKAIRNYLDDESFTEFETPILTKATPEGARDYLLPSRVNPGKFYALPQSPQLFKQLLMMSGMDRYYQIARCFRDEDLRADRQPEFTQLDIEMSFVEEADVQSLAEGLIRDAFAKVMDVELPNPFPRLSFNEAMERFGSDKPDLRLALELVSVDDLVKDVEFAVFAGPANDEDSRVAALRVPGGAEFSRKQIDQLTDLVKKHGARGLAWMKVNDAAAGAEGIQSPIAKFLDEAAINSITQRTGVESGDILFFGAGKTDEVNAYMGALRLAAGRAMNLFEPGWKPLWVTDFPMFEWDEEAGRHFSMHHPFTAPSVSEPEELKSSAATALSQGYDMVLNGAEIGGGSIRIHTPEMQSAVFDLLGIGAAEADAKFGFLLEALRYGCPPHGGIAFGMDRIVALMAGEDSIRDVIAFPKTTTAHCPLTKAPSSVPDEQLAELHIQLREDKADSE